MSAPLRIALATTFRDERESLRANFLYHRFIGVEKFFVYNDGSTDGTEETLLDLPFVEVLRSVPPGSYASAPGMEVHARQHQEKFQARQCLNTYNAFSKAKEEGFDWLLNVDADELVCLDRARSRPGDLVRFFSLVGDGVQQVSFSTFEACQRCFHRDALAFADESLFLHPEAHYRRREVPDPLRRRWYGPRPRYGFQANGFLGHNLGKVAVRPGSPIVPWNPHRWVGVDGQALATMTAPHLLHYYAPDFRSFVSKLTNLRGYASRSLHGGKVGAYKLLWVEMVNSGRLTHDELAAYYRDHVMMGEPELQARRRSGKVFCLRFGRPSVVEITAVANAFREDPELAREAARVCSEQRLHPWPPR